MSDALDLNDPGIAEDFVNNPVISDAEAIGALGTSELMRTVRQRVFRQFAHGLDERGPPPDAADCGCPSSWSYATGC